MKKLITLLLLVISNCSYGQVSSSSQTFEYINNELIVYHSIQFNFGAGESCPEYISYQFSESNNDISLNITYNIIGTWQSFFCERKDTFILQVPEGVYDLTVCVDIINTDINTQLIDTTNFSCDFYSNNILGTEELSFLENSISIFPNPVSTTLSITSKNGVSIKRIKLYDLQGREIMLNTTNFNKIDVSNLPTGNYFLEIETDKGVLRKNLMIE